MAYFWRCPECGRLFTLDDDEDASEVAYGHDCEAQDFPVVTDGYLGGREEVK